MKLNVLRSGLQQPGTATPAPAPELEAGPYPPLVVPIDCEGAPNGARGCAGAWMNLEKAQNGYGTNVIYRVNILDGDGDGYENVVRFVEALEKKGWRLLVPHVQRWDNSYGEKNWRFFIVPPPGARP